MIRPTTRGELVEQLRFGNECEVAGYVAEMTAIMLRSWLEFDQFIVEPSSENPGWVIFKPIK